jgi:hypothetical protein
MNRNAETSGGSTRLMRLASGMLAIVVCLGPHNLYAQTQAIDVSKSSLKIRVFKSGAFSAFAHDHEIQAPINEGKIVYRDSYLRYELGFCPTPSHRSSLTQEQVMRRRKCPDNLRPAVDHSQDARMCILSGRLLLGAACVNNRQPPGLALEVTLSVHTIIGVPGRPKRVES